MATITFTGVSPRSLGDLLKGYALMALIGEQGPNTVFYWDAAGHLVAQNGEPAADWEVKIKEHIHCRVPHWASTVGKEFARPMRGNKKKGKQEQPSKLTRQLNFDSFDSKLAQCAWAAAIPDRPTDKADTRSHPWFGAHGQDGSGDYFATLRDLSLPNALAQAANDAGLDWSLYRRSSPGVAKSKNKLLASGGVLFPEPMKRYATGAAKWIREGDAPVSQWCYALALYGALSLRGSLRRMRFARSNYPSFPFVFEGADAWEVHLPVWSDQHPRTLREWQMQIAQFQVRVRGDALASNAVEFRAAVASRGVAVGFDRFYRFVLEERRPGQQQYLQQAILRGITHAGVPGVVDIRLLVAPLAENGWLGKLESKRRLPKKASPDQLRRFEHRERIERAIHAAIDESAPEHALEILRTLWATDQLLARQALGGENDAGGKVPAPAPLVDPAPWERALQGLLIHSAEHRIARAIGSMLGASESGSEVSTSGVSRDSEGQGTRVSSESVTGTRYIGGALWQLLPIDARHRWDKERGASVLAWRGAAPEQNFAELLWRRWLCSAGAGMQHLAIRARRTARVSDVVRLLSGELNVKLIHELVPLYALLDWRRFRADEREEESRSGRGDDSVGPVPAAYAILRSWLHLAVYPCEDESAARDGSILRLLATMSAPQATRAVAHAFHRLRIRGLPTTDDKTRPFGKSVAHAHVEVSTETARLLPLALLIPISSAEAQRLASRLLVMSPQHEPMEANV
jgi:CRISPR-associated protein Csx17